MPCFKTGGTWDGDQELSQHPNAATASYNDEDIGYFERLGANTETLLEKYFTIWGTYCANNPWFILFLGKTGRSKNRSPFKWKSINHFSLLLFLNRPVFCCCNGPWY